MGVGRRRMFKVSTEGVSGGGNDPRFALPPHAIFSRETFEVTLYHLSLTRGQQISMA